MNKKIILIASIILILVISVLSYTTIKTYTSSSKYRINRIIKDFNNSVVMINTYRGDNKQLVGTGSGFIYNNNVITNYHVIKMASFAEIVLNDGQKKNIMSIANYNPKYDIAILKLRDEKDLKNIKSVKLGDSDEIKPGEEILAIGSPLGMQNTITNGIVSNPMRMLEGIKAIQISAPISPGSSGGALFNMDGKVVGITYAGMDQGDINFAIPINIIKPFLGKEQFITFHKAQEEELLKLQKEIKDLYNYNDVKVKINSKAQFEIEVSKYESPKLYEIYNTFPELELERYASRYDELAEIGSLINDRYGGIVKIFYQRFIYFANKSHIPTELKNKAYLVKDQNLWRVFDEFIICSNETGKFKIIDSGN